MRSHIFLVLAAATAACASPSARSHPSVPSDANLAAMMMAANNTDISYARLVAARAESPAVMEFAQRMLADHGGVNQMITDILRRIGLDPEENAASLDLRDESAAKRDVLRELSGRAFDSAYVANEVAYHSRLLTTLDDVMLPAVRNFELRQLLTGTRAAVVAHLDHAQHLQSGLP